MSPAHNVRTLLSSYHILRYSLIGMGALLAIARRIFRTKKLDVCILGLDNAGKSTILEAMCGTLQLKNSVPTIGMNIKQLKTYGVSMTAFDLVRAIMVPMYPDLLMIGWSATISGRVASLCGRV